MNNETKFTPGPWTIEKNVKAGGVIHLAVTARHAGNDWMPCSVSPQKDARDTDYANAKLIAKSPTMFAALERIKYLLAVDSDNLKNKGEFYQTPEVCECKTLARAILAEIKEGK